MQNLSYKVFCQYPDGTRECVTDNKSLRVYLLPDGGLVCEDRLAGEFFDTGNLEVVFDDSETQQPSKEIIEALEFYANSSEYAKETKPVGNLRLVLREGKVLQDKGKLARKTLRNLTAKLKGESKDGV